MFLATSTASDNDVVWTLSNALFPATSQLSETQNTLGLDGKTWALSEIPTACALHLGNVPPAPEPPLIVTQHKSAPRKFVFLTTQCCHIVTQLRPVDILRQLLVDAGGPDSTAVRAFFQVIQFCFHFISHNGEFRLLISAHLSWSTIHLRLLKNIYVYNKPPFPHTYHASNSMSFKLNLNYITNLAFTNFGVF